MGQLNESDRDKISEVSQICMAHSATSLNLMIGREVKISTPMLKVVNRMDMRNILTAFGVGSVTVQIDFKSDFYINNLLMFKGNDIKIIMDLMMGGTGVPADGELNDMHISCVSEVMNQMMGASAVALTNMIHKTVDINPPKAVLVNAQTDIDQISQFTFEGDEVTIVVFHFESQGLLKGIMITMYPMKETRFICDNVSIK